MQGWVREIAVEIVRADGSRLPALVNSTMHDRGPGQPPIVRTMVFDATDRRRYEEELLRARRREQRDRPAAAAQPAARGRPHRLQGSRSRSSTSRPSAGLEVGGDWYDAFWLEEGRSIALVVGDVVGRGIGAAATMGQLRSAVRALASTGVRPGALLDALDTLLAPSRGRAQHDSDLRRARPRDRRSCGSPVRAIPRPCSCRQARSRAWCGTGDPRRWTSASHPGGPRPEASCSLTPGSSVLLYTDGLVERRSQPMMDTPGRARRAGGTASRQLGRHARGRSRRSARRGDARRRRVPARRAARRARSAFVAGEHRDHLVLQPLGADRADAVLEQREDDRVAGFVEAVAAERRDAVERARLRAAARRGPRCPSCGAAACPTRRAPPARRGSRRPPGGRPSRPAGGRSGAGRRGRRATGRSRRASAPSRRGRAGTSWAAAMPAFVEPPAPARAPSSLSSVSA